MQYACVRECKLYATETEASPPCVIPEHPVFARRQSVGRGRGRPTSRRPRTTSLPPIICPAALTPHLLIFPYPPLDERFRWLPPPFSLIAPQGPPLPLPFLHCRLCLRGPRGWRALLSVSVWGWRRRRATRRGNSSGGSSTITRRPSRARSTRGTTTSGCARY